MIQVRIYLQTTVSKEELEDEDTEKGDDKSSSGGTVECRSKVK